MIRVIDFLVNLVCVGLKLYIKQLGTIHKSRPQVRGEGQYDKSGTSVL